MLKQIVSSTAKFYQSDFPKLVVLKHSTKASMIALWASYPVLSANHHDIAPVSCYYMTSFKYGGKKSRNVGLTCRCHLSNIMRESIFYDSMEWGITYFCKDDNHCLPQHKRDGFMCLTLSHQWTLSHQKPKAIMN